MKKAKKKSNKKTAWVLIALIITIIAAYWKREWIKGLFSKNNETAVDREIETNTNSGTIATKPVSNTIDTYPIKTGARGEYIKYLQKGLNSAYGAGLVVDGIYGTKTASALLTYHKRYQIKDKADYNKVLTELNNIAVNK